MSEPLTELWCKANLTAMHWNPKINGGQVEYWITTWQGKRDAYREWDSRLSVCFNWELGEGCRVMLIAPSVGIALRGISTVEQFKEFYELVTGRAFKSVAKKRAR